MLFAFLYRTIGTTRRQVITFNDEPFYLPALS